jgi:hypothetical protein
MSIDTSSIDNSYLLFVRSKEVKQLNDNFNSNMNINLDASISRSNVTQDIHLQLSSCEIPVSFYNFSSNLNNINLFLDGSSSLILTEQHYDIYDLIDEITNNVTFPYSATFNDKKSKITLINTDATQHTINFSEDSSKGLAKALGFNREDIIVSAGGSITSDDVINLNTIHSIFVHTNLPIVNVITTTNNNYRNIIQKIPVNKNFGEIINYNPYQNSLFSSVINSNEINNFNISLRDQNDTLIQFNDVNYEISFLFEVHSTNMITSEEISGGRRSLVEGGGRRSFIPQTPVQPIKDINIPQPLKPRLESQQLSQLSQPVLQQLYPQQLAGFSQPKPEPKIPVIDDSALKEDIVLDDKQNDMLQNALLDIALLDEIV